MTKRRWLACVFLGMLMLGAKNWTMRLMLPRFRFRLRDNKQVIPWSLVANPRSISALTSSWGPAVAQRIYCIDTNRVESTRPRVFLPDRTGSTAGPLLQPAASAETSWTATVSGRRTLSVPNPDDPGENYAAPGTTFLTASCGPLIRNGNTLCLGSPASNDEESFIGHQVPGFPTGFHSATDAPHNSAGVPSAPRPSTGPEFLLPPRISPELLPHRVPHGVHSFEPPLMLS